MAAMPTTFMGQSLNMAGRYGRPAPSGRYLPPGRTQSAPWMPTMPTTFMGQSLNMAGRYGPTTPNPTGPTYLPAQTSGTSGTTVTAPPAPAAPAFTDPRDATYYGNVSASQRSTADKIAGYQRQQTDAANALPTFDYTQGVEDPTTGAFTGPGAALGRQYGLSVLAQQLANARRGGGGASASLAQRIGDIGQTYQGKYTAAQSSYQKLADQLAQQVLGAQDAEGQYESGQYESAADRASQAAQTNPTVGGVAPPVTQPGAAPSGTITTHPNGAFYKYYVKATGHAPPATVAVTNPTYRAWQRGGKS